MCWFDVCKRGTGQLKALDSEWIQVVFEAPQLKLGSWEFRYGGQSEVKLRITYVDDKIRLGLGSRGSLFVFQRRWNWNAIKVPFKKSYEFVPFYNAQFLVWYDYECT